MSVVEQIRSTPPYIALTDCAFDFSLVPKAAYDEMAQTPQPVTREMVEAFLSDPWAQMSPYDLARSWLELDAELKGERAETVLNFGEMDRLARRLKEAREKIQQLKDMLRTVSEDRDWWEAEGRAQASAAETQRQRATILTDRLEKNLDKAHLEP